MSQLSNSSSYPLDVGTVDRLRAVLLARSSDIPTTVMMAATAALVVTSGAVHLHLWDIAYRHVATLGPLFLVQGFASIALGLGLIVLRHTFLALAALVLMLGTLLGFVLVVTVGLFGFKLHVVTGWAVLSLTAEGSAAVMALLTCWRTSSVRRIPTLRER